MVTQTNQGAGAPNAALSYKEECVPITSTRSEVAGDIVHAMQVQLTPKEQARLARSQRTNSEAYDLYLRALVHVGLENRQDNQAAVELLEQAVARDPKFAPAYAALGREYRTKAFIVDPKGKQWEEKAINSQASTTISAFLTRPLEKRRRRLLSIPAIRERDSVWGLIFSTKANTKSRSRHFEIRSGFFRHSLRFNPPCSLSTGKEG